GEGSLVAPNRVVVRVDRAGPVAGRDQVARPTRSVGAEAPVMAERREVAQPVRTRAGGALERPGRALVKLGPSRQQEVLVDDLVNERVREPVPASIVPLALSPD